MGRINLHTAEDMVAKYPGVNARFLYQLLLVVCQRLIVRNARDRAPVTSSWSIARIVGELLDEIGRRDLDLFLSVLLIRLAIRRTVVPVSILAARRRFNQGESVG